MLLDAGNTADVPTDAGDLRTRGLRESMAALGYKAIGVGDHDLSLGFDDFEKRIAGIDVPFVSSNIVRQGTLDPVLKPFTIVEAKAKDGRPVRVGVVSVMRFNPVWQKAGPAGTNLAVAEPLAMLKSVLPRVRAASDIVVLLATMPKDDLHELAKQLQDLDMIVASYGGIASASEEAEGRVRIYYAGNQGKWVGESRITLDAKRRPSQIVTYMHFLTAQYPEDKPMKDAVAKITAKAGPGGAEVHKKEEPAAPAAPLPGAH